jgi:hypothetical protein
VTSVHTARNPGDRLSDRQTLIIGHGRAGSLKIAGVALPGFVSELAESLTVLCDSDTPS